MHRFAPRAFVYAALLVIATSSLCCARPIHAVSFGTAMIAGHRVKYLIVHLNDVRIVTGLGYDRVARTESLAHMALRNHALAAIDGGFFESSFHGPYKDLIGTTTVDGRLVFKGDVGCTLFFNAENEPSIAEIPLRIEGGMNGDYASPDDWYAYWINRYPENGRPTATIFTPMWGTTTHVHGFQVQVAGGVVRRISKRPLVIPPNGYVVYVRNIPALERLFRVGLHIEYRVVRSNGETLGAFGDARQAIGGGPRLIVDGRIALDPRAEGFRDPQLFRIVERSVVGVSRDRRTLILATATGSLHQMARIMRRLGAYEAMNLDGGASSGLWARGHYLTTPQRLLTNALLVLPLAH
jgi:hypothetical protein